MIRGFHSISLMRYDDMVAVRSGRRTTIVTAAGEPGRVDRRLPGRVAAPHDDDVVAGELARGRHRGAVVDPAADQLLERVDAEAAVVDPGRDEHRPGVHVAALGVHDVVARRRSHGEMPVAGQPVKKRVPNRSACPRARWASRMPEMPRGKPR